MFWTIFKYDDEDSSLPGYVDGPYPSSEAARKAAEESEHRSNPFCREHSDYTVVESKARPEGLTWGAKT